LSESADLLNNAAPGKELRGRQRKGSHLQALAVALTAAIALIAPIEAGNLRNSGGAGATGNASVIGSRPGEVMWTYYDTT
jgi:hypothetical protein